MALSEGLTERRVRVRPVGTVASVTAVPAAWHGEGVWDLTPTRVADLAVGAAVDVASTELEL